MYIRGHHTNTEPVPPLVIPAGAARRMAKLQRGSIEYILQHLNSIGQPTIDGIYASTALGCLEDTEKFLEEITGPSTSLRSPLPFMRSTHNTIAGQLALLLKIHGPNITHSQELFGFHSALLNALLHCEEEPKSTLLVFATDEETELSASLLNALHPADNLKLGAGYACFVVGIEPKANDRAKITLNEQGAVSDTEHWNNIITASKAEHIYWSAYPANAELPAFPANAKAERYDLETGHHGAQTAQALALSIENIATKKITGPCMILDIFDDRIGALVVEPC
ncbi:MAG: beta-ketoacyl synthase chain length factor [Flavobacteriales bacterium]|nr:beta-ketoacyl synthase chain length factor [Flavobacteriales bacterium]MBK6943478.1 beta-ketoacyl synthase chain length factor [Flavobacteriales bacterium]MBK7240634.1 beta-ketoacyl synthase chain length factor [Flavobacteriales bacterium]MBK7297321.1 beta-ketoacyl synthase chain length factor [Flavobacteriales bacterium]MBK9535985.1 beta-ketoacyl synthase chain length factor [Flavobacteriales bacterium]